eukprot:4608253-Pyramimonas_sp.AAC.1
MRCAFQCFQHTINKRGVFKYLNERVLPLLVENRGGSLEVPSPPPPLKPGGVTAGSNPPSPPTNDSRSSGHWDSGGDGGGGDSGVRTVGQWWG